MYNTNTQPTNAMREVLHYYRPTAPGAHRPGSFGAALISAFALADAKNFNLLYGAFPEYGHAMSMAMHGTFGGIDTLAAAAAPKE